MKIYILTVDSRSDYDKYNLIEVYSNLQDALAEFNKMFVDDREEIRLNEDWCIDEDTDTSFEAYLDGFEASEHLYMNIISREV